MLEICIFRENLLHLIVVQIYVICINKQEIQGRRKDVAVKNVEQ